MTRHLSVRQRWKIITLRFDIELSIPEIARRLKCSFSTVHRIINLFLETDDVLERKGRGSKPSVQGSVRREFREVMRRYPSGTSAFIADRLESRTGVHLSDRSIRRIRRQENYHPVHSKLHWAINFTQAACRFQFASTHFFDDWHNVIFTDEKCSQLTNVVEYTGFQLVLPDRKHLSVR